MIITICLDGGAGRVFTAIPALEKFVKAHPKDKIKILVYGWADLFFGHPLLHELVYFSDSKESMDHINESDVLICPEPYHNIDYIKGKLSLSQTFDLLINGSFESPEKYTYNFYPTKEEEIIALDVISAAKKHSGKNKVVVIQPFGSEAKETDHTVIIDKSSRSMELTTYYGLLEKLKEEYALVYMSNLNVEEHVSAKPKTNHRAWYSIIEQSDYFVGVDSLGQHYAYATKKPGTIIFGGTNPTNVSYSHHFNIFKKENIKIKYSPIRLFNNNSYYADCYNDRNMLYEQSDLDSMCNSILNHIELNLENNNEPIEQINQPNLSPCN
jgi:ADP-heptose:LPS heptosyltransferase